MIVGSRQTLIDLAMQHAGAAEAAFEMCVQHDFEITKELEAGSILPEPVVLNNEVVTLYRTEKAKPASILIKQMPGEEDEGIDFWAIETDFEVQ
ncbi:MAG: hypothetical protein RL172_2130 [Bacteroidota bacterium]|jgi:hypothetical protein